MNRPNTSRGERARQVAATAWNVTKQTAIVVATIAWGLVALGLFDVGVTVIAAALFPGYQGPDAQP